MISQENFDRFMARIHASGFIYPEGRMNTPERFMLDCINMLIQPIGNPLFVAQIVNMVRGRLRICRVDSPITAVWLDPDDLTHWEPHIG